MPIIALGKTVMRDLRRDKQVGSGVWVMQHELDMAERCLADAALRLDNSLRIAVQLRDLDLQDRLIVARAEVYRTLGRLREFVGE